MIISRADSESGIDDLNIRVLQLPEGEKSFLKQCVEIRPTRSVTGPSP